MSPRAAVLDVRQALQAAAQAQRATAAALEALAALVSAPADAPSALQTGQEIDPNALLTVAQAAKRIGMSESFVYHALEAGRLPSVAIGNRRRIQASELAAFVQERASNPRSEP